MSAVNPNNNKQKRNDIMELWYRLTGEAFGKVNLATNKDFEKAIPAETKQYIEQINKKEIPLVWDEPIRVNGDKNLHISLFHDFNLYDMQNPQKGVEDETSFEAIKCALNNKNPNDKNVAILCGDIVGKEFTISALNNASIEKKRVLFWGLEKRMDKLIDYLICIAENGADEIILMNGRDEHKANKMLNRDILKDALIDRFNNIILKYAVEKVNRKMEKKSKKVKISYVPGVKKVFTIEKSINGKKTYYDVAIHTNLKSTSLTMKGNRNAAEKQHGGLAQADVVFVAGENTVGNYSNVFFVSGLSKYKNTSKAYVPQPSVKGYNSFDLLLGESSHEIEAVRSANFINSDTYALEKKIAKEENEQIFLLDLIGKKLAEMGQEFYQNPVDYKVIINNNDNKGKGEQ